MPDVSPLSGQQPALTGRTPLVEVRRSARRRRTVSAYRDGDTIVVLLPARLTKADERRLVGEMVAKVTDREEALRIRGPRSSDAALARRAAELSRAHLDGRARPSSVRWVTNMRHRWGSATPSDGTIRLSHRLRSMPEWVIDYVLVHELSHLIEGGHGPEFWAWANRYPRTERARGFLEGVALSGQLPAVPDSGSDSGFDFDSEPDAPGPCSLW
ncbi:M48 family metallopeptidase [soil metagenome]